MKLHIYKNQEELSESIAEWMCGVIEKTLKEQEYFSLVLSGGSTPQSLYKLLVSDKYKNKINWSRIHVFWGDERAVPYSDERNNAKMAHELLLNHVDIPASHVH